MTTTELTTLRIECAERMGWTPTLPNRSWPNPYWTSPGTKILSVFEELPPYNSCHNAAFTLVAALAAEGWNCTIECHTDGTHHVSFWKDTVIKKDEEHSAHADTLPAAICRAFKEVKQSK